MTIEIKHLDERDFEKIEIGLGKLSVVRYIAPEDKKILGGFTKFEKGEKIEGWPYWYDEICYVVKGKAKLTYSSQPLFNIEKVIEVREGDVFYIPKGTIISYEGISDEPCITFYVAVPNPY